MIPPSEVSLPVTEPHEVRLRVSGIASTKGQAQRIGHEVESLYTNGPAGGGGARHAAAEMVSVRSALVPREAVQTSVESTDVGAQGRDDA